MYTALLFACAFWTLLAVSEQTCPGECTCSHHEGTPGSIVDCAGRGLRRIPSPLPHDSYVIHLENNYITQIEETSFLDCPKVREIDVSHNGLTTIEQFAFKGTRLLESLRLNDNRLNLDDWKSVPKGIFQDLLNLKSLLIHNNSLRGRTYPDELFQWLRNLETLKIDGIANGVPFGEGFAQLSNLRCLHVYGNFNYTADDTFRAFNSSILNELSVKSQKLYDIEPYAFGHLHNLTFLSLSDNINLGLKNASKGWYGLQFTSIEHLVLQNCEDRWFWGAKPRLHEHFYDYLNLTNIKSLWLDGNSLGGADVWKLHIYLPNLRILSMACNGLEIGLPPMFDILFLTKLRYLSLAFQSVTRLARTECNESLADIGHVIETFASSDESKCSSTNTSLSPSSFLSSRLHWVYIPPCIEHFDLRGWNFFGLVDQIYIFGMTSLRYADVSSNSFHKLQGPVEVMYPNPNITLTLKVNSNGIDYVSPNLGIQTLQKGLKITHLEAFDNLLGSQLDNDTEGKLFEEFTDLRTLNLGQNGIKVLQTKLLKNMFALESINLTKNSLRQIDFNAFRHMKNISVIDLSYNLLTSIDQYGMGVLDTFKSPNHTGLKLHLEGNPLICSCITLPFLKWLNVTWIQFTGYRSYICEYNNRLITLDEFYGKFVNNLEVHCSSSGIVIVIAVLFGVFILLLVTAVCVYRHRWDVRFFCLSLVIKRKKYDEIMKEDESSCCYDAFVAYHQSDSSWVINEMLPNLESEGEDEASTSSQRQTRPLELLLHQRNFIPGHPIVDNIVNAIKNSRKTIIVLSREFARSEWCDFEMQMARIRCFDKGRDLLVVIKLEDIPTELMSKTLKTIFKQQTYIEWPENVRQRDAFWERIRTALLHPEVLPVRCECGNVPLPSSSQVD